MSTFHMLKPFLINIFEVFDRTPTRQTTLGSCLANRPRFFSLSSSFRAPKAFVKAQFGPADAAHVDHVHDPHVKAFPDQYFRGIRSNADSPIGRAFLSFDYVRLIVAQDGNLVVKAQVVHAATVDVDHGNIPQVLDVSDRYFRASDIPIED